MPKPFVLANEVDAGFKDASAYDRHRPTYPTEAVQKLLKNLNVADQFNARIVEVGAGTGKFTELLTKRKEEYDIIAIEPHTEMRDGLVTKKLGDQVVVKG
jgi:16S rRNA A1518/A1519 N6-dimethyltransferase RsmA/KsgA/DIM1 with predicted DNA glycosylase/AP lyase activity